MQQYQQTNTSHKKNTKIKKQKKNNYVYKYVLRMHINNHTAIKPSLFGHSVHARWQPLAAVCIRYFLLLLPLLLHRYACMYASAFGCNAAVVCLFCCCYYFCSCCCHLCLPCCCCCNSKCSIYAYYIKRVSVSIVCVLLCGFRVFVGTQPFATLYWCASMAVAYIHMYVFHNIDSKSLMCLPVYTYVDGWANKCLHVCVGIYSIADVLVCFPMCIEAVCEYACVLVFGLQLTSFPLS